MLWTFITNNCHVIVLVWFAAYFTAKILLAEKYMGLFLVPSGIVYFAIFLFLTLLGRPVYPVMQYELSFLWEYRLAFSGRRDFMWQILNNILLFVPMGILYGELRKIGGEKRHRTACKPGGSDRRGWIEVLFAGALASLAVELLQLVCRRGLFEFDDILNNTVGMAVGYTLHKLTERIKRVRRKGAQNV